MNFESLIKQALAQGMPAETIVASFTETLNKIEKDNKSKKERETYLINVRTMVKSAIERGEYNFTIAAIIAGIAAAAEHPSWTVDQINKVISAMEASFKGTAELSDFLFNNPDFGEICDTIERTLGLKGENSDDIKIRRFLSGLH